MMTEFEVRRRVADISDAQMTPARKARMLLRLGKCLNAQAADLQTATRRVATAADPNATASLARMARHAVELRREMRDEALTFLRGS